MRGLFLLLVCFAVTLLAIAPAMASYVHF